jgi:thioredoxin reductase
MKTISEQMDVVIAGGGTAGHMAALQAGTGRGKNICH